MELILNNLHAGTGIALIIIIIRAMNNGICVARMTEKRLYILAFFLITLRLCQILLQPQYQEAAAVLFDGYLIGATWKITRPAKAEKPKTENSKNIIL